MSNEELKRELEALKLLLELQNSRINKLELEVKKMQKYIWLEEEK